MKRVCKHKHIEKKLRTVATNCLNCKRRLRGLSSYFIFIKSKYQAQIIIDYQFSSFLLDLQNSTYGLMRNNLYAQNLHHF